MNTKKSKKNCYHGIFNIFLDWTLQHCVMYYAVGSGVLYFISSKVHDAVVQSSLPYNQGCNVRCRAVAGSKIANRFYGCSKLYNRIELNLTSQLVGPY